MVENIAISINNLCFQYSQPNYGLRNLNLTIATGEKVGIIGANGAGKTTLFLCMTGILNFQGAINLFGKPVKTGEFYPEIGLVFQNPDDQLFCPKVKDDVAFGPENMGLSPSIIEERVKEALSLTGVTHLSERAPHHLSGGEKSMVAIASILAMQPQLVLYDEPSANLDLCARRRLIQFLQSAKHTILVSSHDLDLIVEVCSRVILLNQGQIIADDIPEKIISDQNLMLNNGLEVPSFLSLYRTKSKNI